VQAIPAIFRDAIKTIAICEDDGIYDCCAQAMTDFKDWHDLSKKLLDHVSNHWKEIYEESYLQRLWTL
jgi:hypothetical protein